MASELIETQLQEIASESDRAFAMGPFGSNIKAENYCESGVPVIRGTNLGGCGDAPFIPRDFVFLTEAKADELASSSAAPNDIVFVAQGTVGKVGIIPTNTPYRRFVLSQNLMKVTVNPERADPRFIFYFYRSSFGQHEIMSRVNPTGVPCISKPLSSLRQFMVRLPSDVNEQRAIAHILGTLDDKIELNRQVSETLEAIARTIFKSWFVDFDPVRAKTEGRDPGLPQHLAVLFPDSLEDSEMGEIPKGWQVGTLGALCQKPQYGFTASAREKPVGPKFLRITDINKLPWIEWALVPHCEISKEEFDQYRVRTGDVLIARMADPGHGVMIEEDVEAVFASYLIRFRPRDSSYARFVQYWLRSKSYWDLVGARYAGTTRASLNAQVLSAFQIIVPPKPLAAAFAEKIAAIRRRLIGSVAESHSLASIRDTLLPRFISGSLHIRNVERIIGGLQP